ncbi:MAG: outer membrane protein assembly factor BamD [Bacteroidetes bacterium]|jgi:outer membrane protein assembly factor BamD|nr:outer membrane protein assembly factor BamD [Bacteroidota bacterium]MCB0604517.1 outer membrane protein assembly factor BamD [Saprospiraceae bacterium]MCO5279007.1 outer membrane protein assembly factor BamD [Saprospiraceae bacterium]
MLKKNLILLFCLGCILLTSCKSEYEKLRASNDVELVYKKALEYYNKKDYYKAQNLIEQILGRYRGKKEAEDLYVKYAYTHYYQGNYILASSYFQNFANTYITSSLREEAAFMSAYSNYLQSPDYKLDQTYTLKAISELEVFVNTFPKSERLKESNKLIDELRAKLEKKAFEEGLLYYNLKQYQSASITFNNMLKDFPDSDNIEQIRYYIVKANYTLAENSIYSKKLDRYQETLVAAELFKSKFFKSKDLKEVNSILKQTKENIKKLENDGHQDKGAGNRS